MNAEIVHALQKLNAAQRKILLNKISDSERLLQIVHFVEQKKSVFQNHEIIAAVFKISFNDKEFPKARNNYFKLRKKLVQIISEIEVEEETILPIEQELMVCRKLIADHQYASAKRKLLELKNELWQNNIFEHLSDCIYKLMSVEQCLGSGYSEEFRKLNMEYDLACDLKRDLEKQLFYYGGRYHLNHEPNFLKKMAHLAEKNEKHSRFKIIYLYTKVLYGITLPIPKRTAMGNFEKLEKLLENNPEIPVYHYVSNSYLKIRGYWLPMIKMHYAMLHRDFLEGFELMKEYKNTLKNNAKTFGGQQNENLFKNEISACIYAGKYKEALQIVEELKEFQIQNGKKENHLHNYIEIANIYTFAYPSLKTTQLNSIVSFLDELIKKAKGSDADLYKDAHLAAALLLYTYGFKNKSKKYFEVKVNQEEITRLQIADIAKLFNSKIDKEFCKEIFLKNIKESPSPIQETYYKWALNILEIGQ